MLDVIKGTGKNSHGVDVVSLFDHRFERVIHRIASIYVTQLLPPIGTQIGDAGYFAIRMFVPIELCAEAATHEAHADSLG